MKYLGFIIGITFLSLISCDTIEGPYIENPDELVSTVTVFEFTGIGCVYCPENGHEVVAGYEESFGENLKTVAIHGKEFGDPIDGFFLATKEGEQIAQEMVVNNLPKGSANTFLAGSATAPAALGDKIAQVGYKFPDLVLNVTMDIDGDRATVSVLGKFDELLSESYGELYIGVYLIQNDISGPQKDYRGDHEDYEHKHTFRQSFNGILGSLYVTAPDNGMEVDEMNFSLNLNEVPLVFEEDQTISDLELEPVVFVYKNDDSKEFIPIKVIYN